MKALVTLIIGIFTSILVYAGGNSEKIHESFSTKPGVVSMSFSKEMFDAFDIDIDWKESLKNFNGDFTKVKLLILSSENSGSQSSDLLNQLKKQGYKEIEMDEDDGANISVWIDKKRREFNEVHLLSTGKDGGMLISVYGNFVITDK